MKVASIGRIVFGILFVVSGLINLAFTITNPRVYKTFAEGTLIPLYGYFWTRIVVPNQILFLVLLVLFELTVGVLILSKGRLVKLGLACGLLFTLFLIPFNAFTIYNVILVVLQALLLLGKYDRSLPEMLRAAFRPRGA